MNSKTFSRPALVCILICQLFGPLIFYHTMDIQQVEQMLAQLVSNAVKSVVEKQVLIEKTTDQRLLSVTEDLASIRNVLASS